MCVSVSLSVYLVISKEVSLCSPSWPWIYANPASAFTPRITGIKYIPGSKWEV